MTLFSIVTKFRVTAAPLSVNHALYNSNAGNGGLYLRIQTDGTLHFLKSQIADIGSGLLKDGYAIGKTYTNGFTINNGNYALYDKGMSIKAGTTAQTFTMGVPRLGHEALTFDRCSGIFYFCYIYNRALSPSEIQQLYQEPYCFIKSPEPWYKQVVSGIVGRLISVIEN